MTRVSARRGRLKVDPDEVVRCKQCGARLSRYREPDDVLCAPCQPVVPVEQLWRNDEIRRSWRRAA